MTIHGTPEAPNSAVPETGRRRLSRTTRWQTEFPYHWDADSFISRRSMLRLAVYTSGALFAVTAGIVGLRYLVPTERKTATRAIVPINALPPGSVHYFQYPTAQDQAILLHLREGRFVAYSGRCTHLSCSVYYDQARDLLLCPCHDGIFDPRTGEPVAGPPQRPLPRILLKQNANLLYAVEEHPS